LWCATGFTFHAANLTEATLSPREARGILKLSFGGASGVQEKKLRVSQCFQKGHEGALVRCAQWHATIGMFGEIGIERGASFHAGGIMLDDLLQCGERSVMHVGRRDRDVPQGWHGKLAVVGGFSGDLAPARIGEFIVQSVVSERLALEQRPAVAMKA